MKKQPCLRLFVLILTMSTGTHAANDNTPSALDLILNVTANSSIVQSELVMTSLIKSCTEETRGLRTRTEYAIHDRDSDLYSTSVSITNELNDSKEATITYARAMVTSLRTSLDQAYNDAMERLTRQRNHALEQREKARQTLAQLNKVESLIQPDNVPIKDHFDQLVDLSELQPETSATEAFELLRNSVDPPLQLIVLWKELLDNADIEMTTTIEMDGLPNVRMGMALKLVLKSLSGGFYHLNYHIEDGVVVVSSKNKTHLTEPSRLALAKLESVDHIFERRQELRLTRDEVDMKTAQGRAHLTAITQAIVQINQRIDKALKADPMIAQLDPLINDLDKKIKDVQDLTPEAYMMVIEKLVSMRTKLAEYQMDVIDRAGGTELSQLNKELTQWTIDMAGDQAQLDKLNEGLLRAEQELEAVMSLETRVKEIQFADMALEEAQTQVFELEKQINALQPPTVTVLGLD
jgi:hypothetical protein